MRARAFCPPLLIGLIGLTSLTGCKKLTDEVPYKAVIMMDGHSDSSILLLIGGDLLLDGKTIASVGPGQETQFILNADWTGPKADVRSVLKGTYTIQLPGLCGDLSLAAEGPNDLWQNMSENDLAENVESDGSVPIFITPQIPKRHDLVIDWGSGAHTVKVGAVELNKGTAKEGDKSVPVFLDGCEAAPSVEVDGKAVGTLDLGSPAHLISTEATRCHRITEIPFGDHKEPVAEPIVTTSQVTPLESIPYYLFEEAPTILTVPEGIDGTSVRELVGRPCAGSAPAAPANAEGAPKDGPPPK